MRRAAGHLFVAVAAVGCTSMHNLNVSDNPFGGGYRDREWRRGFFEVQASSNFSPVPNFGPARETFRRRAEELCRGSNYQEFGVSEFTLTRGERPLPYVFSVKNGFVLCPNAELTLEAAKELRGLQ